MWQMFQYTEEECIFSTDGWNALQVSEVCLIYSTFEVFYFFSFIFCVVVLAVIGSRVQNFQLFLWNCLFFPFHSLSFFFLYFRTLFFPAYMFIISIFIIIKMSLVTLFIFQFLLVFHCYCKNHLKLNCIEQKIIIFQFLKSEVHLLKNVLISPCCCFLLLLFVVLFVQ